MIELKYMEKRYAGSDAYVYVRDMTIQKGEIVGILGENGSGKTTLLKSIMGIGEVQNGSITIEGKPASELYDRMAFITEEGSFFPDLTPDEYAQFLAGFFTRFDRELYDKLLKFYELEPEDAIKTFSKGQKAKLEICAGLAKKADYLLMDEPLIGKDMFTRRDFFKLMLSGLRGDETVLFATHLIDDVEHVIDRAIIMKKGRVAADFYIDEMREQGRTLAEMMAEASGYKADKYRDVFE
ncbi:ATP-binding cassette domain-containing protein [Paenibacillus contaminans]|uniref:ABC transporter ATP-binding protein n=1 Tax=Paenibacillus contaminans TaxID=450362 RepID=A0A329MTK5_9BACL|nr:ABC transporter ATP-binding protein [Paenibacillus contaminans]RAV23295.1 ABC transporter ATP-binding protein [Paenibacillus contaminans]